MTTTNNTPNQTPWLSDDELDRLIADSLQRQDVIEDIHHEVMREVRRSARRETVRRWARAAIFAFGLPLLLLCSGLGLYYISTGIDIQKQPYMLVVVILPAITMLLITGKALRDFSISKV